VGPYLSTLPALQLSAGNTYYIVVDGYGSDCGEYILDIVFVPPPPPICPPGAPEEGEPECYDGYVDHFNGGCQSEPEAFSYLCPNPGGATVERCGTSGTFQTMGSDYRDTDWYEVAVTEPNDLTICAMGEFPLELVLMDGSLGCSAPPEIIDSFFADPYEQGCASASVEPGTYWIFVSPSIFSGVGCGSLYYLTVDGFTGVPSPVEGTTWGALKGLFK
jgi:hypothetical protein